MTSQSELDSLTKVWKALESFGPPEGWSTLEVWRSPVVRILAGRKFPEALEALLVGLPGVVIPAALQLPAGRGFHLVRPKIELAGPESGWLALVRRHAGKEDLFSAVAEDVTSLLHSMEACSGQAVLAAVIDRVRAWQAFMERSRREVLSSEAELGLVGELMVLAGAMDAGAPHLEIVAAWQGPLDALQDFCLPTGAIEVKATSNAVGFPANIHSLDQLDRSMVQNLWLAATRVAICEDGQTLPSIVGGIRERLPDGPERAAFDSRMIHAGLHPGFEGEYHRRFILQGIELLEVGEGFPVLTHANVHAVISEATYVLEIDQIPGPRTTLTTALSSLGVI